MFNGADKHSQVNKNRRKPIHIKFSEIVFRSIDCVSNNSVGDDELREI